MVERPSYRDIYNIDVRPRYPRAIGFPPTARIPIDQHVGRGILPRRAMFITAIGFGWPSPDQPSIPDQPSPAQPNPTQPSPAQPSPAQPSPEEGRILRYS